LGRRNIGALGAELRQPNYRARRDEPPNDLRTVFAELHDLRNARGQQHNRSDGISLLEDYPTAREFGLACRRNDFLAIPLSNVGEHREMFN
jgi:hypothetical protein